MTLLIILIACRRVKGTHPVVADVVKMELSVIPVAITAIKLQLQ